MSEASITAMSDPTVSAFLTKLLCSNQGRLPRDQLPSHLDLPPGQIEMMLLEDPQRFPLLAGDLVVARNPLRICPVYVKGNLEEEDCGQLHLCPYYIKGRCWRNRRPPCTLCHSIQSEHNQTVLKNNQLSGLNENEIKVLLLQNDNLLLPMVCNKYLHDKCNDGDGCRWLHVCGFFTRGECSRDPCKKSHNLLHNTVSVLLKKMGYPDVSIQNFQMLCLLKHKEFLQSIREGGRERSASRNNVKGGAQNVPHKMRRKKKKKAGAQSKQVSSKQVTDSGEIAVDESSDDAENGEGPNILPDHPLDLPPVEDHKQPRKLCPVFKEEQTLVDIPEIRNLHTMSIRNPHTPVNTPPAADTSVNAAAPSSNLKTTSGQGDKAIGVPPATASSIRKSSITSPEATTSGLAANTSSFQKSTFTSPETPVKIDAVNSSRFQPAAYSYSGNSTVLFSNLKTTSGQGDKHIDVSPATASSIRKSSITSPEAISGLAANTSSFKKSTFTSPETPMKIDAVNSSRFQPAGSVSSVKSSVPSSTITTPEVSRSVSTVSSSNFLKSPFTNPETLLNMSTVNGSNIQQSTYCRQDTFRFTNSEDLIDSPANKSFILPKRNTMSPAPGSGNLYRRVVDYNTGKQMPLQEADWKYFDDLASTRSERPENIIQNPIKPPVKSKPYEQISKKTGADKMSGVPEICLFNIWNYCKLGSKCEAMHFYLPYRWQFLRGSEWVDLQEMEEIEKAYCDPNISRTLLVDFQTMKYGSHTVRRLSTPSSVTKPSEYVLTTEWIWYWKNEFNSWIQYGNLNPKQQTASLSSDQLESIYLAGPTEEIPFQAGKQNYKINFKGMFQTNLVYGTQREVCRRPKYVSFEEARKLKGSTKSATVSSPLKNGNYPPNWSPNSLPELGYKLVDVPPDSAEYAKIQAMFVSTLPKQSVKRIQRIQNPSLWQVFQWQKEQMKKQNQGKDINEQHLFHGTGSSHVNAICHQNFDWRICGTNGTVYGQGSYFARDASYSHNYTTPNLSGSRRMMFVAHVLVGDFVLGNAALKRPPYKPGSTTHAYDSCVDYLLQPSIFVVFEKHQIYPEYLLEYEEKTEKSCSIC